MPIPWPTPRPIPPWWLCRRREPISGRYEGGATTVGPIPLIRSLLDLRVDIDSGYANSPVMNRVSGDLYRIQPSIWPDPPVRVYQESWIIDAPSASWSPCQVEITGTVRWWQGTHPPTGARIVIPWNWTSIGPATVTLTESGGRSWTYSCSKRSPFFRELEVEVDVCTSVNAAPIVPSYDTHAHNTRPASLPRRNLTIEESYREAGVNVTIDPARTVIDDSAPGFVSWSPAELHDAMEINYSRFTQPWPAWRMWGLLAGRFDNAGVGGIMFDAAAGFGGAGRAPERQGFAVFRNHSWFNNLPGGAPANQVQAEALRKYLYTWVHEAGHAFNFLHSWDKARPDALSWMNYDWRYDQRNGANSFWSNFDLRFDDEELIHMRHGNRAAVIMGGDPWSSGGHMESPPVGAMTQMDGAAPLELLLRCKRYFEFMEPVHVELRLRNETPVPVDIDARLEPEFGTVAIFVRRPDARVVEFAPIMCELGTPEVRTLAPADAGDGTDRYSESVFIGYGAEGFVFDVPGEYLVRAVYQGFGDLTVPSNTLRLRVGNPIRVEEDVFADDYFTHEVGLCLYLGGSQSRYLEKGMASLERAAEEFPHTMLAARAGETLGRSAGRSFFHIPDPEKEMKLAEADSPDPERQLALTEPAVEVYRERKDPNLNLSYHRLVRDRAAALAAADRKDEAGQELSALGKDLKARGVNKVVLDDIKAAAKDLP
jgi:hypothetical protein